MTAFPLTVFDGSLAGLVGGACFAGGLAIACVTDVRRRRIPNPLVVALSLLGVVYSVVTMPPAIGLARAVIGFGIGFSLWVAFYAFGMLGAGDVKLFAAACCWLAPSQVFSAALISALAGGLLSIVGLMFAHGVRLTMFRVAHAARDPALLTTTLPVPKGRKTLPYGLAMAIGLLASAWFPRLLRLT